MDKEALKKEAAEAFRQNVLVPGFEHVHRGDWESAYIIGALSREAKIEELKKELLNLVGEKMNLLHKLEEKQDEKC